MYYADTTPAARAIALGYTRGTYQQNRHDAAVALGYVYRNLCHIPRNMRITAAMAAGVTDKVWSLADLMAAALDAPAVDKPDAQPLAFREPTTTARPLPDGRGFLRVVGATGGAPAPSSPTPGPAAPPVAVAAPAVGQLDLLSWRPQPAAPAKPLPPKGTQLGLF